MNLSKSFNKLANRVSRAAGRPATFAVCVAVVLVWAASGPVFKFSETWQLVINTGTTIVTFLMVFLIQNTQNRDNAALQAKLDELIRVSRGENAFIGSNTSLVAPVTVGNGAYVASGSVITTDVPDDAVAFGRARQENKEGRAVLIRERNQAIKDAKKKAAK